jgi:cytoskeletal protein CcmA (bactofilin family)
MSDSMAARMSTKYGVDYFDDDERPRLVVVGNYVLSGVHQGGVHVEAGEFRLHGTLEGGLDIQTGVDAVIRGRQQGSVSVAAGANVAVIGSIEGGVHIARGGELVIEPSGRLAGSLDNYGDVIIRGVFGGTTTGDRSVRLEGSGYIKQPVVRDGVNYYEW